MTRRTRRRLSQIGQWTALAPLLPFFVIYCVGQAIVEVTDWLIHERWLARACFRLQHRIEMWGLR